MAKLVESLASLTLTEKKIRQKEEFIRRYAARPSFREDAFGKDGAEAKKVEEALQSCMDMIRQHEDLKRSIDYTNLVTEVEVAGKKYTIHSLLLHKRSLIKLKRRIWKALDDSQAHQEVNALRMRNSDAKITAQVVYSYDIQQKEDELAALDEMEATMDSALQIANSKIDLVEPPKVSSKNR